MTATANLQLAIPRTITPLLQPQSSCPFPRDLLRDRVAVVTGASRGIGRATALRLAEAGADVVVNYIHHEQAAVEVVEAVRDRGGSALAIRANVARPHGAEILIEAALERFGRVDLLVANAGVWQGAPLEEMPESVWDEVLDVNLKGTWTACRAAVPSMRRNGHGSIVIVSSTAGQRGEAGYCNYAAAKGGQISLTKSLAAELSPAIRVNCVAPGWVDTELNNPVFCDEDYKQSVTQTIPLRRLATADDVARAIVFLASDWSEHITGEVMNVNGGAVLCG
jgi:3-oxoacyl-[acyl-carrier protein] reductase